MGAVFVHGRRLRLQGVALVHGRLSLFVFMGLHLCSWAGIFVRGRSPSFMGIHVRWWATAFVHGQSCHLCGVVVGVRVRLWVVVIVGGRAIGGAQWWGVGGVWWPAVGVWWWVLMAVCGGLVVWWCHCCGCVEGPDGACSGCRFLSLC